MSILLFENNFSTTLSAAISATDTSMTLQSVTGLPTIVGDQYFKLTLVNSDSTLFEIVDVTAVSGNVVTMRRGSEGTTASAWTAGSAISGQWTAGSAQAMQQTAQAQAQGANYATFVGGTENAISAGFYPAITSHTPGMPLRFLVAATNTGPTTFDPGPSVVDVRGPSGSPLVGGELVAGEVATLIYTGVFYQLAPVLASQTVVGTTRLATNAETSAGSNANIAVSPAGLASLGLSAAITALQSAVAALEATGSQGSSGYIAIPVYGSGWGPGFNHLYIQWGTVSISINAAFANQTFSFTTAFPNICFGAVATAQTNAVFNPTSEGNNWNAIAYGSSINTPPTRTGGTIRIDSQNGSSHSGTVNVFYIAIGV